MQDNGWIIRGPLLEERQSCICHISLLCWSVKLCRLSAKCIAGKFDAVVVSISGLRARVHPRRPLLGHRRRLRGNLQRVRKNILGSPLRQLRLQGLHGRRHCRHILVNRVDQLFVLWKITTATSSCVRHCQSLPPWSNICRTQISSGLDCKY